MAVGGRRVVLTSTRRRSAGTSMIDGIRVDARDQIEPTFRVPAVRIDCGFMELAGLEPRVFPGRGSMPTCSNDGRSARACQRAGVSRSNQCLRSRHRNPRLAPIPRRKPQQPPARPAKQQPVPAGQRSHLPRWQRALAGRVVGDALRARARRRKELLRLRAPDRVGDQPPVIFPERQRDRLQRTAVGDSRKDQLGLKQ